jgi:hypothetical protein
MTSSIKKWRVLPALVLICALGAASAAVAQTSPEPQASTPSTQNEVKGATTGLGSSHRFGTVADATSHCPGTIIVWSSGPNLIYQLPGSNDYGKGSGFYACKDEAEAAGFHAVNN